MTVSSVLLVLAAILPSQEDGSLPVSTMEGWRLTRDTLESRPPAPLILAGSGMEARRMVSVQDGLRREFLISEEEDRPFFSPIQEAYLHRSPLHQSKRAVTAIPDKTVQSAELDLPTRFSTRFRTALPLVDEHRVELIFATADGLELHLYELGFTGTQPTVLSGPKVLAKFEQQASIQLDHRDQRRMYLTIGETHCVLEPESDRQEASTNLSAVEILRGEMPLSPAQLIAALDSESPHVRAEAIALFEGSLPEATPETMSAIIGALRGGGEVYARQLACSLGEIADTPGGIRGLCVLMTRRAKDRWLRLAVRSGLEGEELEMLRVLIGMRSWQENKPGSFEGTRELAADILHSGRRLEVLQLINIALGPKRQPWHVEAIAQAFGVAEGADARESLRAIRASNDFESAEIRGLFERGQKSYEESCVSCHRPSGYGYDLRGPNGRVADGSKGLGSLRGILDGPKHAGVDSPSDLTDLHRYLRLEWLPLKR